MPDHYHARGRVQDVRWRAVVENHVVVDGENERVALGNLIGQERKLECRPVAICVDVGLRRLDVAERIVEGLWLDVVTLHNALRYYMKSSIYLYATLGQSLH